MAAKIGAKTAIEKIKDEQNKQQKEIHDRILRNTKLLLQNYRLFNTHVTTAIKELEDLSEDTFQIFEALMLRPSDESEIFVGSITKSMAKTAIVMAHIKEAVEIYYAYCKSSPKPENMRRYRVIEALYLSDERVQTVEEIAEQEHIDCRTVYKDVDSAVEVLSVLFFGVDGLKYKHPQSPGAKSGH